MTDTHPAAEAPDPLVAQAEERRLILRELTEIGMDIARDLRREVRERATPPALPPPAGSGLDPVEAFARISRAIRLTVRLEARAADSLAALIAGEPERRARAEAVAESRRVEAARRAEAEAEARREARHRTIHRLVRDVIDREAETMDEHVDLEDALDERLCEDPAYADLEGLPTQTIVKRLCDDLQLNPDWRRWTGDGWRRDPHLLRPRACEFHRPSRMPIFGLDGEPRGGALARHA